MKQIYRCILLTVLVIAVCTSCAKEEKVEKEEKKPQVDWLICQADLADMSLYARESNEEVIVLSIPLIASEELKDAKLNEQKWKFGDSTLLSAEVSLDEVYKEYYLYVILIRMTIPTVGDRVTELPLLIDGKEISYRFGRMYCVEHDYRFVKGEEAKLFFNDNDFEIPTSHLDQIDFTVGAKAAVRIKDIFLSSEEIAVSDDSLKVYRNQVCKKGETIQAFLDIVNAVNKFYLFETVINYCEDCEDPEEEYLLSMCSTRTKALSVMKAYVDAANE